MSLIQPHGGSLCDLLVNEDERVNIQHEIINYPSLTLNDRQLCDMEMLLNGGFSPLKGFMAEDDYLSVMETYRLSDGTIWPIPITLDVSKEISNNLNIGEKIVLRDHEGVALGILVISDNDIALTPVVGPSFSIIPLLNVM